MLPMILQQLGSVQPNPMSQIKQMMNMVKSAKDPMAMLNMMAMRNPQLKEVLDIVKQYGGDSMAALRGEAEKMGVDPDEILNMIK